MRQSIGGRGVAAVAVFGAAALANAQVLLSNGPYQTHPDGGPSNAPRSVLQNAVLGLETYGFGCQKVNGNRLADDFAVPGGTKMKITGFQFYAYQTGNTSPTINDVNIRLWGGGAPNAGGSVVAGSPTTNLFASAVSSGVYRVDDQPGGNTVTTRLIMQVSANFTSPVILNTGTFWADWQMGGSLPSGPWQVPVTILGQTAKPGANAIQFIGSPTNTWQAATDDFGPAQDMAFRILGTWLENPESYLVVTGQEIAGTLSSFAASDNDRHSLLADEFNPNTSVELSATAPLGAVSSIGITVELSATRNDLSQRIELQNTAGVWEQVDVSISSLTDVVRSVTIGSNPNRFIRPGNEIKARVRSIPTQDIIAFDGWAHSIDLVEWELTP